uniref:Piwi domain-containing protein n=1 Tax=Ditylenchus dipsaci TaxID=166011 RepID=A0A915CSB1_9BILA
MGVDGASVDNFIGRLLDTCQRRGMQVQQPTRSEVFERTDVEYVRAKMEFYHKANCGFVMFFTKDKLDDVHHTMKLMETEWDLTTQHVSSQTVQKALGTKGAQMVIDNVSLKFNLKLGVSTMECRRPIKCASKPCLPARCCGQGMDGGCSSVYRLDMSHAGPQSLYERQAKIPATEPTIVGMAYTCGHPLLMRGTYWCQKTRETSILELTSRVKQAIMNYAEKAKRWPLHLMVYRGGTSEGAFATVADQEQGAFVAAFAELQTEQTDFQTPELTIVVVQHNSNYRVVPTNINPQGRPHEQNVRPGTVVDQAVMHPSYTEFLLVGHKTIQGTAQPIRCTVVVDNCEPRMPLEELEYVSYNLCYAHGIVLSPVSVPAPLYSASDLAKRGRNNWKVSRFGIEDRGYDKNTLRDQELPPDFFEECNDVLRPDVPTKFWA